MYLFNFLILLACVNEEKCVRRSQDYNWNIFKSDYYYRANNRLLEMMRSYYEEATARITYMNPMRFMYEESPQYEMGYIIGEIIERYRKVVEHTQKPPKYKFYTLIDTLKHVELAQKLYFELYHLVRMLHETPRKWKYEQEFADIEKIAGADLIGGRDTEGTGKKFEILSKEQLQDMFNVKQRLWELEKYREKEKKRRKKKYEKIRQQFLAGVLTDMKGERKPFPKSWPLDYGWEINASLW